MLIKCPQCQLIYDINDVLMKDEGLKMHCSHCNHVFTAYPTDALPKDPETSKNEVAEMFEKAYGDNIEDLFAPELSNRSKTKIRIIRSIIYKNKINWFLIFVILALLSALLYFLRYDVVRLIPDAEKFYQKLGIESILDGRYLHLENISTQEFVSDNVSKIKIRGIISNPSVYTLNILPLKVICYDQNGQKLSQTTHKIEQTRTYPNFRIPFEIVLTNPTPEYKNFQITFTDFSKGE